MSSPKSNLWGLFDHDAYGRSGNPRNISVGGKDSSAWTVLEWWGHDWEGDWVASSKEIESSWDNDRSFNQYGFSISSMGWWCWLVHSLQGVSFDGGTKQKHYSFF